MFATAVGVVVIVITLWECFEAMVLPRRIARRWRLTRIYYRGTWWAWRRVCGLLPLRRYRANALSVFGPLSLFGLFIVWVTMLVNGFALICWGCETLAVEMRGSYWLCLYHSGETFFTLGYGDMTPVTRAGQLLAVVEAGTGFGFMAVMIGYLPVLHQAFSDRERAIALLDARAGSPPTASELLRRAGRIDDCAEMERFLADWERWSAALLESHLSFPVLGFYRSQHDNQSWLAALAVVLDSTAVLLTTGGEPFRRRAELTFALARHASVDLCLVFWQPPVEPEQERLTAEEAENLLARESEGEGRSAEQTARLGELRALYEPFLQALSNYFGLFLPRFFPERDKPDNWQTTAWTQRAPGITELAGDRARADEHFD